METMNFIITGATFVIASAALVEVAKLHNKIDLMMLKNDEEKYKLPLLIDRFHKETRENIKEYLNTQTEELSSVVVSTATAKTKKTTKTKKENADVSEKKPADK